ncbi:hypothetical protein OIU84_008775 [Salix udensis]|uniref:Uncharacterized protein n=1 Tax=Salix udensis TaxID=889485 RepID=A0AAD6JQL7_9ROSI|nr:hypothetical protein OIU84_008775 [Salix udensis]
MMITVGISLVTNEHCYQDQFMPTAKIFQWHGASGCHMFKENAKTDSDCNERLMLMLLIVSNLVKMFVSLTLTTHRAI